MGKRTKKVFIIGLMAIFLGCCNKPLLLLTIGEKTLAKVKYINKEYLIVSRSRMNYPVVEFYTSDSCRIIFEGGIDAEKIVYVGQKVEVLYLSFYPGFAEIYSFTSLFSGCIMKLMICLFLWVGFLTSFKYLLDKKKKDDSEDEFY